VIIEKIFQIDTVFFDIIKQEAVGREALQGGWCHGISH
jgi:hypothetical protein